jgi:putative polyketide hydroxylase
MDATAALRRSLQGLPFEALLIGKDLDDPEQCYRKAFGISGGGATLVRPDGFVAWRSPLAVGDAASALHAALRESLGLGGPLRQPTALT